MHLWVVARPSPRDRLSVRVDGSVADPLSPFKIPGNLEPMKPQASVLNLTWLVIFCVLYQNKGKGLQRSIPEMHVTCKRLSSEQISPLAAGKPLRILKMPSPMIKSSEAAATPRKQHSCEICNCLSGSSTGSTTTTMMRMTMSQQVYFLSWSHCRPPED